MESPSNSSASNSSTSPFLQIISNNEDANGVNYEHFSCSDAGSARSLFPPLLQELPTNFPSVASHISPSPLSSPILQASPHQFSPKYPTDIQSNHPVFHQYSPDHVSACHDPALIRFPVTPMDSTKRDWLSSLSQPSPALGLSALVPACMPSSPPTSFGHQQSLIAAQNPCEKSTALRPSSSTNNLQTCKTLSSSLQLRDHTSHIDMGSSDVQLGRGGCSKVHDDDDDDDDDVQLRVQGSLEGVNACRTALRLSDVIAALRVKTSDSQQLASSADPELIVQYCHVDTSSAQSSVNLVNAEELGQRSCYTKGQQLAPARSEREPESRPGMVSTTEIVMHDMKTMNTRRKGQGFDGARKLKDSSRRSEDHIYSERERRQRMTHLYATLRSLLPKAMSIKADRCSVLTETMEYIQSLLEELDELGKQKVELVLASTMQAAKKAEQNSPDESTASTEKNAVVAPAREIHDALEATDRAPAFFAHCGGAETGSKALHAEAGQQCTAQGQGYANMGSSLEEEYCNSSDEDRRVDVCKKEKGVIRLQGGRGEVRIRLFGQDAFITVHTLKKTGAWSNVLEVLQQLGIHILNVTLSASLESNHHCIHGKIASGRKLNSYALKRSLKMFVTEAKKSIPRGGSKGSLH